MPYPNNNNLAVQPETISHFLEDLVGVEPHQVYGLPDLTKEVDHGGRYSTRPKTKLSEGIFIDRTALAHDAGVLQLDAKPRGFGFDVQPGLRLGREASHNQVFFGKLLLRGVYDGAGLIETHVAIKPTVNRAALLGELAMFQHMRSLSDIPTFEPFGYLATAPTRPDYLLTRFEKRIATMDTIEWNDLDDAEKWEQLGFAVATASLLHSNMLFSGDLEFKNVAFGETGDLKIIDPELMVSAAAVGEIALTSKNDEERARAVQTIKRKISVDMTSLCTSIDQFILTTLVPPERHYKDVTKLKRYKHYLFEPYERALKDHGSPYLPVLLEAYALMLSERKQRAQETSSPA